MTQKTWEWIRKRVGWKIEGHDFKSTPKAIIAVAPHTSTWDFPVGLMARGAWGIDAKFMGKHTLFKPPFGWLFRWLGGIPVDRTKHTNLVDDIADRFNKSSNLLIAMAPEGTRKKVDKFKTGFYYIAKKAGIPIVMCRFDFGHKKVVFSEPFFPTDDPTADMQFVWDYFKGVQGYYPSFSIE